MIRFKNTLILYVIAAVSFACANSYKFKIKAPKKVTLNQTITLEVTEQANKTIDKVKFYVNGKSLESTGTKLTLNTATIGVGKHAVNAIVFFNTNKTKKINSSLEVFANTKPTIYSYKIINTYPHDKTAYTQGLEYHNGFLYETTGRKGKSTLRKVVLKTGEIKQKVALDNIYFGEGMTIVDDAIIWLTWQSKKGFVYNLNTFKKEGEFAYNKSKEGWGLTQNKNHLIKSDGTNKIWFLDKKTLAEKHYIQAYTHDRALPQLNELELINGELYANYYQKPIIAIINPKTGVVNGLINLKGLQKEMSKTQNLVKDDEVLNGIAFDAENNRLFVTGKHWGKLFEIEIVKQ